ncbi:MAG: HNH endonuclease [Clostridia bacterium]|nr:HNH endonuclease [Clostridia bacterium]
MDIKSVKLNEVSMPSVSENKSFDPDKRIDVNQKQDTEDPSKYDVDKRLESNTVEHIKCPNEHLAGDVQPKTGVPFEKKIIDLGDRKIEGVFPIFDSDFDAQLPKELLAESDAKQFKECNKQLKDAIEANPSLREKFTDDQIEQILDGEKPDGKVWHHNEEVGKMQLVDFETHDKTAHMGGKSIWGGGQECR